MATIIVVGRIGSDAELRETQGGTKVASFSVADDVGYGEKKSTQWIKCAVFGKRAEAIHSYLTKGSVVEVVGAPVAEGWTKDGQAKSQIKVSVSEIKLHGGGKRDEPVADRGRATRGHDIDDDLPF